MGKISFVVLLLLVSMTLAQQINGLALVATYQGHEATGNHYKRSICNTFGGCSSKRTIQPLISEGAFEKTGQQQQQVENNSNSNNIKRDNNAGLIQEVVDDLLEYMQNNEKYRQGKYVIVVPKHPIYENNAPAGSLYSLITNNHISPIEANSAELQELQIVKRSD